MIRAYLLVALVAADYIDEVNRIGTLYANGLLSKEEFDQLKSDALNTHQAEERHRRLSDDSGKTDSQTTEAVCLSSMISTTNKPKSDCGDQIARADQASVKALYAYLVSKGGGVKEYQTLVKNNADLIKNNGDRLKKQLDRLDNLNAEVMSILQKVNKGAMPAECKIIDARHKSIGGTGQINSSGGTYYFANWSRNAAVADGDNTTTVDAHDEAVAIRVAGSCDKCVKVYGNTYDYHQAAWSTDGKSWIGFAVNRWQKCYGHSCGENGAGKSQSNHYLPITFNPWQGKKWSYFVYSQANGSRRVYDLEVVNCSENVLKM